jgi:eukaryotic-like serine/threonine-protein kinase
MSDPKSGAKADGESRPPNPLEDDKTLSESAFGQLTPAERVRSGHASFQPKTVLANRFRVVRFIARGGMGEVYEAEDLELRERVAVKCVRFEYANSEHATERFRREIQLARRVTHLNVCRTYDVFRHTPEGSEAAGLEILVVSMELLSGKTLSREIEEKGKLTPEQSLPIITQIAAGLGAAHQAGIVHRDFKSANVLLVPSERSSGDFRVVITDFGLARDTGGSATRLTGTLDVVGTPAYMAPEQLNGGEITPATDIYALGIVMYEMLTGTTPHKAESAIALALRRLSEPAPSLRLSVPEVDAKWDATVQHCLQREPSNRFATADEVMKTLRGEIAAPKPRRAKSRFPFRWWIAAAAIAGLLMSGLWFGYRKGKGQSSPSSTAQVVAEGKARPSVAVLGFQNKSEGGSDALLGGMLTDGLWAQLDINEIRFIPPRQVDDMKRNLGIADMSSPDEKQLARIQDYLGCDKVIAGTYRVTTEASGKNIDWNIQLFGKGEPAGGRPIPMIHGKEANLNEMVANAGKKTRSELNVELSGAEETRLDNSLSTNAEALRYFSEAREKRREFDVSGTIKALQNALRADDKFAQAHSALAEAWADLGYESKAAEEAKKAVDLSSKLSTEAHGLIVGRYYEMTHDWSKAIENYASLRTLYDDNPEYGWLLARSQTSAGKGIAALATLDQTQQKKNLPNGLSALLDLARSEAQESLGDFPAQLKAATSAAAKAKSLRSNLLLARSRIQECSAQLNLGEPQKARPLCEEALKLNTEAGDQLGSAHAVNVVANAAWQQGDLDGAKKLYGQALSIAQTIGDKLDESGALNNLANILDNQGDHAAAIANYKKSIEVAKERGDKYGLALAQQNFGVALFEVGKANEGGEMLRRAIQNAREVGDKATEATVLNNLCFYSLEAGDPKKAMGYCESSLQLRTGIASKPSIARSLVNRGSVYIALGNLRDARKDYEDALQLHDSLNQKGDAAYTRIALARLALKEKRFGDAQKLSADAEGELSAEKDSEGEAEARALSGQAKAAMNDLAGSQTEIAAAIKLTEKTAEKKTRLRVEMAGALVALALGKNEEAVSNMQKVEKEARVSGLVALSLEAKLALGQAEIRTGKTTQGKLILAELAREAKAKGFSLISEDATRGE